MNILKRIMNGLVKKHQHKKHIFTTDVIRFNRFKRLPKDHPFRDREFKGAFKDYEKNKT